MIVLSGGWCRPRPLGKRTAGRGVSNFDVNLVRISGQFALECSRRGGRREGVARPPVGWSDRACPALTGDYKSSGNWKLLWHKLPSRLGASARRDKVLLRHRSST